jgi:hypothetical protein
MRAWSAPCLGMAVLGAGVVVAPDPAVAQAVVVRNLTVTDEAVSGDLVNTSDHLVRDVRLLVRHTWLWTSERSPGEESPGRAAYPTVREDIPPGGSRSFTVPVDPPLPVRPDGRFQTGVDVVGFTEVGD